MRIQHNIPAMNSYRNYTANTKAVSKNLEKLSSGYRINRAGDDAAGLAISEKMRAQVTGLKTAQRNAKDGISLIQTAEGALTEVHSMLNRMVELADQSANGTYDKDTDRKNLQKEFTALSSEIDRISLATNFNGISLLTGDFKANTTPGAGSVIDPDTLTDSLNGQAPSAATKAKVTIDLNGTTTTGGGLTIVGGTTTIADLGAMVVDGQKLSELFEISIKAGSKDWGTDGTTVIASGDKIELTAKVGGQLSAAAMTALDGVTGTSGLDVVPGTAEGAGTAPTKSEYKLNFDFKKIADGQTFTIGDKTFELSTDGALSAGSANTLIDIKGLDLTAPGASATTGQWGAATAIRAAVNTAFGADFAVEAAPTAAPSGDKFVLNFKAKFGGDAGNLGQVRVSESATGAIGATYTAGKPEGKAQPGSFAKVEYDLDLTKLAVGDKISIGGKEITIVESDAEEDLTNGKMMLSKAQDGAKLAAAFEGLGFASGKLSIADGKLTITDKVVGGTSDNLKANDGKVAFTPKTAPAGSTTSGGLTLQIGDTSDDFNQISVFINNTNCESLGIDATKVNIKEQKDASAAVEVIKNAINSVSSTRGDLGAVQNRLEHTINNLSVMTENIQDAESSIRDVDVAEEMMAYTKNNILVQSAQAMLAQANQLPQGVLQLLG